MTEKLSERVLAEVKAEINEIELELYKKGLCRVLKEIETSEHILEGLNSRLQNILDSIDGLE